MSVGWSSTVQEELAWGTNGESPDRQSAIDEAIAAGRELTRRPDGTVRATVRIGIQTGYTDREIDVMVTGWDEPEIDDTQMRERVDAALIERARMLAESSAAQQHYTEEKAQRGTVWHPTEPGSINEQWHRITRWLNANVTTPVPTGADEAAIAAAAAATGVGWPPEVVQLYRHIDGEGDHPSVLPAHRFLSLAELVDSHAMMVNIYADITEEIRASLDGPDASPGSAGDIAGTFLPEYIPFAGIDGYWLIVDTRAGEFSGCVTEFEKVDGDSDGAQWRSISAMLTDLADALESGTPFGRWWTPTVVDGTLTWEFDKP